MITAGFFCLQNAVFFFFALSTVIAASDHLTRAGYFAAITIFKAHAAVIEVTASGGVGGTGGAHHTQIDVAVARGYGILSDPR